MDLLEAVLGGAIGVEAATLFNDYVRKRGGLQGLVAQFEKTGFGEKVKSWVSTGPNLPISAEQIQQALGSDQLKDVAGKLGIQVDKLVELLAQHLPSAVDKATPEGKVETQEVEKTIPVKHG